jgi:adenosylcobinamide-GDP ribazoletransferase
VILLRAVFAAIAFLTRLPVPGAGSWAPGVAGVSVAFFPAVGLLLGALSAGLAWLVLARFALPPHPVWALALVSAQALFTGALHLDGLSDVVDGLGGSRGDRQRALEIMRDSRIGAFGVVALVLVLLAKVVAMNDVLRGPGCRAVLLAYPTVARLGASILVSLVPCARPTGLAATFHREAHGSVVLAAGFVTVGLLWAQGWATVIPAAWGLGASLATGLYIAARLRGLTGDAYGAAIELGELAFLLAAAFPAVSRGGGG